MTRLPLRRWWPRIQAWRGAYFWVPCPTCGEPFGGQELDDTHHFASIPGGEDDHRLICPSCTNSGVGCRAHAGTWIHDGGCDFVENVPLWAPQDGELPADEPPTEVFEPVEPPHIPAHQQVSVYLDANHTALDAVRANQILNPQQPAPEENDSLTSSARHRAPADDAVPEPKWEVRVAVPAWLPDEALDSLFTAIAEAAHDWEPKDRDEWDIDVSTGPAAETRDA